MRIIRPDVEAYILPKRKKDVMPEYMVFFWKEVSEREFDWEYLIEDCMVIKGASDVCEVITWAKREGKGRLIAVYIMTYPDNKVGSPVAQLTRVYGEYPEGEKHREDDFFEFTA